MPEIKMQVSDIKHQLSLIKPTIEKYIAAIQEREQMKLQCDNEILELKEIFKETFGDDELAKIDLKFKPALSQNLSDFKLSKGSRLKDSEPLQKTILNLLEPQEGLTMKEVYNIINTTIPIKEATIRDRIEKLLDNGIVEKVDPDSQRGRKFRLIKREEA